MTDSREPRMGVDGTEDPPFATGERVGALAHGALREAEAALELALAMIPAKIRAWEDNSVAKGLRAVQRALGKECEERPAPVEERERLALFLEVEAELVADHPVRAHGFRAAARLLRQPAPDRSAPENDETTARRLVDALLPYLDQQYPTHAEVARMIDEWPAPAPETPTGATDDSGQVGGQAADLAAEKRWALDWLRNRIGIADRGVSGVVTTTRSPLNRLRSLLEALEVPESPEGPCVFCLQTVREDDAGACELDDGRWVCSRDCWTRTARMWDPLPTEPESVAQREPGFYEDSYDIVAGNPPDPAEPSPPEPDIWMVVRSNLSRTTHTSREDAEEYAARAPSWHPRIVPLYLRPPAPEKRASEEDVEQVATVLADCWHAGAAWMADGGGDSTGDSLAFLSRRLLRVLGYDTGAEG